MVGVDLQVAAAAVLGEVSALENEDAMVVRTAVEIGTEVDPILVRDLHQIQDQ